MNAKHLLTGLQRHWFWIILALTMTSATVWTLHYHAQAEQAGHAIPWIAALLKGLFAALQFIVLNKELDDTLQPWQWAVLSATQLLTPLFASLALISAIFREHLEPLLLRMELASLPQDSFWLVVTPLQMSPGLVGTLQRSGRRVLVVDGTDILTQPQGCWNVQRDLQSSQIFQGLPVHRAQAVVLASTDEELNLKLLERLQAHLDCFRPAPPLQVHCHIQSHSLLQLFMDQPGLELSNSQVLDVRPLHVPMLCARALVNHPDWMPLRQGSIAITGHSDLAQALVLRLVRLGIATPSRPLQVLWAGTGSNQALAALVHAYPTLHPFMDTAADGMLTLQMPHLNLQTSEMSVSDWLGQQDTQPANALDWPEVIYVAHASSTQNLLDARMLQIHGGMLDPQTPTTRIVALVNTSMLRPAPLPAKEVPWRCTIELMEPDQLLCISLVKDLADVMAQSYDALWSKATQINMASWHQLPFAVKESNRDIADHLPWKLAYAGVEPEDIRQILSPTTPLTLAQRQQLKQRLEDQTVLQSLIRMEQLRYRAFMALQGFKPSKVEQVWPAQLSTSERKQLERALRLNPTLGCALASLPESEVNKDREIIKNTLDAINISKEYGNHLPASKE